MANEIQNPMEHLKLCTDAKIAEITGQTKWTIRRWRLSEGLPTVIIGGRFLYRPEAVLEWIKSKETAGAADIQAGETGVIRAINA